MLVLQACDLKSWEVPARVLVDVVSTYCSMSRFIMLFLQS